MPISKIKGSAINDGAITLAKTDSLFVNTEISGTEAAKMPVGTTAQRASAQSGDIRFNSTLSLMEYYDGTIWKAIDSPPVVSSINPASIPDTDSSVDIVITGANFQSGATVKAVGSDNSVINATTVTVTSSTQVTANFDGTSFNDANEDYDIVLTNSSGLAGTLIESLAVNATPVWTSAASPTTLATVNDGDTISGSTVQVVATDDENATLTYSLGSGSLPAGLSVQSDGTITGTVTAGAGTYASGGETYTPTLSVTDGTNSVNRTFAIVKKWYDGSTSALATTTTYLAANDIQVSQAYLTAPTGHSATGTQQYDMYYDSANNDYYIKLPGVWLDQYGQRTALAGSSGWNYNTQGSYEQGFSLQAGGAFDMDLRWSFTKYFLYMHSTNSDGENNPDDTSSFTEAQFTGISGSVPVGGGSDTNAYISRTETDANGNSLTLTPAALMLNAYSPSNDGNQSFAVGTPNAIHPWKRGGEFSPNFMNSADSSREIMFNMMPGSSYTDGTLSISNTAGTAVTNYRNFPASTSATTKFRAVFYDGGSEKIQIPDFEIWVNGT